MTADPRLRLRQFADGLFPAGGYAHSFGLETYVADGRVQSGRELQAFLSGVLEGSAGPCDAVVVVASGRLAREQDLAGVLALDAEIDAMRPAYELREAGRQMGRQTLRVATALLDAPFLARFANHVETGQTPCQQALVFGVIGGLLGWPAHDSAEAYLQATATTIVSAALRLMPLGQIEGQRALWSMGATISRLAREATTKDVGDLWSFAPGLEIAAMEHFRLDARLFRS